MPRFSGSQIAVETSRDRAHEGTSPLRDAESLPVRLDEPIVVGLDEGLRLFEQRRCRIAEAAVELGCRKREIAHQPLDHESAHAIAIAQMEAAYGRKPVLGYEAMVVGHGNAVLYLAFGQPTDRGGAEPDKGIGRVSRIALEIPVDWAAGERVVDVSPSSVRVCGGSTLAR